MTNTHCTGHAKKESYCGLQRRQNVTCRGALDEKRKGLAYPVTKLKKMVNVDSEMRLFWWEERTSGSNGK